MAHLPSYFAVVLFNLLYEPSYFTAEILMHGEHVGIQASGVFYRAIADGCHGDTATRELRVKIDQALARNTVRASVFKCTGLNKPVLQLKPVQARITKRGVAAV